MVYDQTIHIIQKIIDDVRIQYGISQCSLWNADLSFHQAAREQIFYENKWDKRQ